VHGSPPGPWRAHMASDLRDCRCGRCLLMVANGAAHGRFARQFTNGCSASSATPAGDSVMVAHPGRGVLTWSLTCGSATVAAVPDDARQHCHARSGLARSGSWRPSVPNSGPLCPIRAQVPLPEALSQHAQHDSGLTFAVFIPVPRRAARYQLRGCASAVVVPSVRGYAYRRISSVNREVALQRIGRTDHLSSARIFLRFVPCAS
jgi:hypothetical protein